MRVISLKCGTLGCFLRVWHILKYDVTKICNSMHEYLQSSGLVSRDTWNSSDSHDTNIFYFLFLSCMFWFLCPATVSCSRSVRETLGRHRSKPVVILTRMLMFLKHMRREEKPTRYHWMVYCTYNMLNVFRALLCPSSRARQPATKHCTP